VEGLLITVTHTSFLQSTASSHSECLPPINNWWIEPNHCSTYFSILHVTKWKKISVATCYIGFLMILSVYVIQNVTKIHYYDYLCNCSSWVTLLFLFRVCSTLIYGHSARCPWKLFVTPLLHISITVAIQNSSLSPDWHLDAWVTFTLFSAKTQGNSAHKITWHAISTRTLLPSTHSVSLSAFLLFHPFFKTVAK